MVKVMVKIFVYFSFVFLFSFAPECKNIYKSFFNETEKTHNEKEYKKISLQRISFYSLSPDETDNDPETFSCGKINYKKYQIIAVSRDLFFGPNKEKHLCNKKAKIILNTGEEIEGIIFDTMHPRYTKSADILVKNKETAFSLGVKIGEIVIFE